LARGRARGAEWEQAAIIGVGLLGASLGMALRERKLAGRVVGVARRPETLKAALEVGAADETTADLPAALAGADLVVLATPVRTIIQHLHEIGPHLARGAVITDLGSTKRRIVNAACSLPDPTRFVPGHPMAGSDRSGPRHARAGLFEGATWFLTPAPETDEMALRRVDALARALGAQPLLLEPARHDELVAFSSHLPHALAVSLMNSCLPLLAGDPPLSRIIAGGYRDTTRVAAADPVMWRDIFLTNADALGRALASLRVQLAALEAALDDPEALEALLASASAARREINS